jgi:hypothetical protein
MTSKETPRDLLNMPAEKAIPIMEDMVADMLGQIRKDIKRGKPTQSTPYEERNTE